MVGTYKRAPPFLEQRKEEKRAKKKNMAKEGRKKKKKGEAQVVGTDRARRKQKTPQNLEKCGPALP